MSSHPASPGSAGPPVPPGAVAVIGAGLAGSEASLVLARQGIAVTLYEMRPGRMTPAHKTGAPAELVCSNSLKGDQLPSAHGLLKAELSLLHSPLLAIARECRVPAGSALAVDRAVFSARVLEALEREPNISIVRAEAGGPPAGFALCIVAAGPLASQALTDWLQTVCPSSALHFYDAIAPIIATDSVDMSRAFYGARRDPDGTDYLNCPFNEAEYRAFYDALVSADRAAAREYEDQKYFEACLPVEVVASRGFQALAFGALRPVGLSDPRGGMRPFAVLQLRREDQAGTSCNMVGFQTRLKVGEQKRVFRMIPGLESAEFLRYGSIHRNTYLDSPRLLHRDLSIRIAPSCMLAGQICGNEGYTESIATGHLAALFASARLRGSELAPPPPTTACGGLLRHVTASPSEPFEPSNVNFGLIDPHAEGTVGRKGSRKERHERLCARALQDMGHWTATEAASAGIIF